MVVKGGKKAENERIREWDDDKDSRATSRGLSSWIFFLLFDFGVFLIDAATNVSAGSNDLVPCLGWRIFEKFGFCGVASLSGNFCWGAMRRKVSKECQQGMKTIGRFLRVRTPSDALRFIKVDREVDHRLQQSSCPFYLLWIDRRWTVTVEPLTTIYLSQYGLPSWQGISCIGTRDINFGT